VHGGAEGLRACARGPEPHGCTLVEKVQALPFGSDDGSQFLASGCYLVPFEHKTFLAGHFPYDSPKHVP
jgi:hypothetical protein